MPIEFECDSCGCMGRKSELILVDDKPRCPDCESSNINLSTENTPVDD